MEAAGSCTPAASSAADEASSPEVAGSAASSGSGAAGSRSAARRPPVNDVQLAYDECAGRWLLLNRTAREAVLLPGTDSDGLGYGWAWDDEGYVGDDSGRSSDVDDLLREHVYQDAAGLLYVAVTDPVGELVVTRLTEAELQYEYALLRMKLVLGCQALSLHIAVFQRRGEDGARLFLDANELYRSLGLDAHGGSPGSG